ncbi:hypothetical protein CUZ95_0563 [Enterococcus lactis]|nr:hypothetical protein [Enterococcus lactis]
MYLQQIRRPTLPLTLVLFSIDSLLFMILGELYVNANIFYTKNKRFIP